MYYASIINKTVIIRLDICKWFILTTYFEDTVILYSICDF